MLGISFVEANRSELYPDVQMAKRCQLDPKFSRSDLHNLLGPLPPLAVESQEEYLPTHYGIAKAVVDEDTQWSLKVGKEAVFLVY